MHIYIDIYVCVYMYIYIYIYVCIHTQSTCRSLPARALPPSGDMKTWLEYTCFSIIDIGFEGFMLEPSLLQPCVHVAGPSAPP